MPMPSEPATHHSTMAVAMAPQSMKNKRGNGEDVKRAHGNGGDLVDLAVGGLSAVDFGNRNHVGSNSIRRQTTATVILVSGRAKCQFCN